MVLSRLLQSKAVLMHIGSQIINQFHGWIEKNKCSNVTRQHHAVVLSVFTSAYHPPLSLSPYLPGLINLSAGHWKLCRLTSSLLSSQLCLPTGRWGHVCGRGLSGEWCCDGISSLCWSWWKARQETKRIITDPGWERFLLSLDICWVTALGLNFSSWTYEPCSGYADAGV